MKKKIIICTFYLKRGVSRQRYSRLLEFSTSTPSTLRIRLNQSDPWEPILAGRWQVILVVDGSCGFSSKKLELIGVLHTTETNSLANQT